MVTPLAAVFRWLLTLEDLRARLSLPIDTDAMLRAELDRLREEGVDWLQCSVAVQLRPGDADDVALEPSDRDTFRALLTYVDRRATHWDAPLRQLHRVAAEAAAMRVARGGPAGLERALADLGLQLPSAAHAASLTDISHWYRTVCEAGAPATARRAVALGVVADEVTAGTGLVQLLDPSVHAWLPDSVADQVRLHLLDLAALTRQELARPSLHAVADLLRLVLRTALRLEQGATFGPATVPMTLAALTTALGQHGISLGARVGEALLLLEAPPDLSPGAAVVDVSRVQRALAAVADIMASLAGDHRRHSQGSVPVGAPNPWFPTHDAPRLDSPFASRSAVAAPIRARNWLRRFAAALHRDVAPSIASRLEPVDARRVLVSIAAGYADALRPRHALPEPLATDAQEALRMALDLDAMPGLLASDRGAGSLRSELLWLDRLALHSSSLVSGLRAYPSNEACWLELTVAWLIVGVFRAAEGDAPPPPGSAIASLTLLHVLAPGEEREATSHRLAALCDALVDGGGGERKGDDDSHALRDLVRELRHRRSGDAPMATVELRFRNIQPWLSRHGRHPDVGAAILTGMSLMLESARVSLHRAVVRQYGVGSVLIDAAGRLRIAIPLARSPGDGDASELEAMRARCESLARSALDSLFTEGTPLVAALGRFMREVALDDRHELSRHALPMLSVAVRSSPADADTPPDGFADRHTASEGAAVSCPGCGHVSSSSDYCIACRMAMTLGTAIPARRFIDMSLSRGGDGDLRGVGASMREVLMLDLDRIGALFTRQRDPQDQLSPYGQGTLERVARRSFRFGAQWQLAVGSAVAAAGAEHFELVYLGGDDLVGCSRSRSAVGEASIVRCVTALDEALAPLRAELPSGERLTFSAGTARRRGTESAATTGDGVLMQRARDAEAEAKRLRRDDGEQLLRERARVVLPGGSVVLE